MFHMEFSIYKTFFQDLGSIHQYPKNNHQVVGTADDYYRCDDKTESKQETAQPPSPLWLSVPM